jgi:hypothetical protein
VWEVFSQHGTLVRRRFVPAERSRWCEAVLFRRAADGTADVLPLPSGVVGVEPDVRSYVKFGLSDEPGSQYGRRGSGMPAGTGVPPPAPVAEDGVPVRIVSPAANELGR